MIKKIKDILDKIKTCLQAPLACACTIWSWILDLWLVLKPCRFSLISLLVGFAFFTVAPQGVDILRAMVETHKQNFNDLIVFYLCNWLWALSIWYWARHMLSLKPVHDVAVNPERPERSRRMLEETPRVLGAFAFLILYVAFIKTDQEYATASLKEFALSPTIYAWLFLVSAVIFYIVVRIRRSIFGLQAVKDLYASTRQDFTELPKPAIVFALLLIGISLLALIWTTIDPVITTELGTANLLLIAAANWVFWGTLLAFYEIKYRLPIFIALLVYAFFISASNDNHDMRYNMDKKTNKPLQLTDNRANVKTSFSNWLRAREQDGKTIDGKIPLFIVAAEGGGIRAAYWTGIMLAALQDRDNLFARHVFAMSGVSGGSLGITSFAGLVRARHENADFNAQCNVTNPQKQNVFNYQKCADIFLSNDFLAPVAGRMLYGDLIQRFLPWPIKSFDRARAMERAWHEGWFDLSEKDYFEQPFLNMHKDDKQHLIPALFLNSTWVEKGQRVVTTNIQQGKTFTTLNDLYQVTNRHLPLGTAVHNSARFTYVSPAATVSVWNDTEKRETNWGHLVDGGYFENSGATSAFELLRAIKKQAGDDWNKIIPIVLMITNDPALDDKAQKEPNPYANELLSPLHALLNTRDGRGSYSRALLRKAVLNEGGKYKEFGLQHTEGPVPLGWVLSDAAKATMKERLNCYIREMNGDPFNVPTDVNCNKPKHVEQEPQLTELNRN